MSERIYKVLTSPEQTALSVKYALPASSALAAPVSIVSDRTFNFRISSERVDASGDIVVQSGISYQEFLRNNAMLLAWHNVEAPIGKVLGIWRDHLGLCAKVQVAPPGVSDIADTVCALIINRIVRTCSMGFTVQAKEPIDPTKPRAGQRYLKTTLVELSIVSLPANCDATLIEGVAPQDRTREQRMRRARAIAVVASIDDPVSPPPRKRTKEARLRRARAIAIANGFSPDDPRLPKLA